MLEDDSISPRSRLDEKACPKDSTAGSSWTEGHGQAGKVNSAQAQAHKANSPAGSGSDGGEAPLPRESYGGANGGGTALFNVPPYQRSPPLDMLGPTWNPGQEADGGGTASVNVPPHHQCVPVRVCDSKAHCGGADGGGTAVVNVPPYQCNSTTARRKKKRSATTYGAHPRDTHVVGGECHGVPVGGDASIRSGGFESKTGNKFNLEPAQLPAAAYAPSEVISKVSPAPEDSRTAPATPNYTGDYCGDNSGKATPCPAWKCPICDFNILKLDTRSKRIRWRHAQKCHPEVPRYVFGFRTEKNYMKGKPDRIRRNKEAQDVGDHTVISFEWPRANRPRTPGGSHIIFSHCFLCTKCGKVGGCKRSIQTVKCRPYFGKSETVLNNMRKLRDKANDSQKKRIDKAIKVWTNSRPQARDKHPSSRVRRDLPVLDPKNEQEIAMHYLCHDCGRHKHTNLVDHDTGKCAPDWSKTLTWLAKQKTLGEKNSKEDISERQANLFAEIFKLDLHEVNQEVRHEAARLRGRQNNLPKYGRHSREPPWMKRIKGRLHPKPLRRCSRKTAV